MSGARTNIVPMKPAAEQAAYPAQAPMPYPGMFASGMSGMGMPAGCCPPGGMDALMQCYCDIQAAKNFIGKIVLDLMQTDPAFAAAMVQAIADSGAALPLIGVTNGVAAQAGQVGEYFEVALGFQYPDATNTITNTLTLGVLQPGDWDVWAWAEMTTAFSSASFYMTPLPAGFAHNVEAALASYAGATGAFINSMQVQALISVPSLVNFSATIGTQAGNGAGSMTVYFAARRRR